MIPGTSWWGKSCTGIPNPVASVPAKPLGSANHPIWLYHRVLQLSPRSNWMEEHLRATAAVNHPLKVPVLSYKHHSGVYFTLFTIPKRNGDLTAVIFDLKYVNRYSIWSRSASACRPYNQLQKPYSPRFSWLLSTLQKSICIFPYFQDNTGFSGLPTTAGISSPGLSSLPWYQLLIFPP